MAQYEHLPIYKKAFELSLFLENEVKNFSRYHKYTLGSELRDKSRRAAILIIRANSRTDKLGILLELREILEEIKYVVRLCKEVKAFRNFKTFETFLRLCSSRSRPKMMPSVFSFENVYQAYLDCRYNKRGRRDAIRFEIDAEEKVYDLAERLRERTYRPSPASCFVTEKPKLREIVAAQFEDRVVHHLLVRRLEPLWEPGFIYDSYASRRRKGTHLAVKRLRKFMCEASLNKKRPVYYLQLDIKNYFMSIDKDILFDLIMKRRPPEELIWLIHLIVHRNVAENCVVRSPESLMAKVPPHKSLFRARKNKGLPIGNLTSQFFANIYLDRLDQFVKHTLKCRWYLRYVDDFVMLDSDRQCLEQWHAQTESFLQERLKLNLNPKRYRLRRVSEGVDFLGYIVRPDYVLSRKRVVNNLKAKLRDYEKKLVSERNGVRTVRYDPEIVKGMFQSFNSYLAHFGHADSYRLIANIFETFSFMKHYFFYDVSFRKPKLVMYCHPRCRFRNVYSQYIWFLRLYHRYLIFFRVGCFYEFYEAQASLAVKILGLKMIKPKFGFKRRAGIGDKALERYVEMALKQGRGVLVVEQTGYFSGNLAERRIAVKYDV